MALKDVKQYYYNMQAQYIEMKEDLADFEQGLAEGYITEDQLLAAKEEVSKVEINYLLLAYIMYLLEKPNRIKKHEKFQRQNAALETFFNATQADDKGVAQENNSALNALRKELKQLQKQKD